MTDDSLIQALPELVAFVRRDGTVLRTLGGRRLGLSADGDIVGKTLFDLWPEEVATRLLQIVRRALHDRGTSDAQFTSGGREYEARIAAHGRDRVLCIIRDAAAVEPTHGSADVRGADRGAIERRALFSRLSQSVADALLRESPLALCMVHLQGVAELGRILDFGVIEDMAATQLERVLALLSDASSGYAGRLGENVLLVVIVRSDGRDAVRALVKNLVDILSDPVPVGDATFSVIPSAGVALLGEDGSDARNLLESARSAMMEARRNTDSSVHFYSDTLQLRSLARLDTGRELREAVEQNQLALRYAARRELGSGRLVAVHAYLRWLHPVRGEVTAAEFLPIADSTGLATRLSCWALTQFQRDMPALRAAGGPGMRFSFGPLRGHFSSGALLADVASVFATGVLLPSELELRISERVIAGLANPGAMLRPLVDLGIGVVVDEFGRAFTSLPRLARLPVYGLQLDRRLALAAASDKVAHRAAAAALAVAKALDLVAMSAGIDDESQRQRLQALGCVQGLGDAFGNVTLPGSSHSGKPPRVSR
jgi:predicted signal transduction protein with EAL and GGDEF domain